MRAQLDERLDDADRRVLAAAFRGQRAIGGLDRLIARAGPRLEIDARRVRYPDAFTAVTVRETIDRHLAADPGHGVVLREPRSADALAILADLVGPLPRHARWAGTQVAPRRERLVLLPATRIDDSETATLLGEALSAVTAALRVPGSESRLLVTAAATFADNALIHAGADSSLLSACRNPQANDLQVVVFSRFACPAAVEPVGFVREILQRSRGDLGGLWSLAELAQRRRLDATMRVAVGPARLYSRGARLHVHGQAANVAGFVTSLEVHLRP